MYRSPAPSLPHSSSYRSPSPLTPSGGGGGGGGGGAAEDDGILAQLDAVAPLQSFDAFPKVQASYASKSTRGGLITAAVCWTIFLLVLNDLGEYLYGDLRESFRVDGGIAKEMQLNVDLTVAMPCHYLSVDIRDAVGDRVYLTDALQKDGTTFNPERTGDFTETTTRSSASDVIALSQRRSGLRSLFSFSSPFASSRKHGSYRKTANVVPDGPACRIYGSMEVKKVTGNLHVTTLGHGYMSWEHTDHALMNLSHVIHEWSFGDYYPSIAQPLDMSVEIARTPFTIMQYFLLVVPTTYISSSGKQLETNQYSVTDYKREVEHGKGVPGIFFKYDLEPIHLTLQERTTSFYHFLVRLVGVIGGVWTCTGFGLRTIARLEREVQKSKKGKGRMREGSVGGFLGS